MRNLLFGFVILFLFGFINAAGPLSKKERKTALNYFKETKQRLLKDVKSLSEDQLNWKANDTSWSIANCIEHIAISEKFIADRSYNSLKEEANPARRAEIKYKDEEIINRITDRSKKGKAPEPLRPTGQFGSAQDALKVFIERRDKNMEFFKTTQDDLRNHFISHALFGTIDAYQMMLYLIGHSERHTAQIEEIMRSPGFPK
jgi:uncharacterized damage-inducible protein DinB